MVELLKETFIRMKRLKSINSEIYIFNDILIELFLMKIVITFRKNNACTNNALVYFYL